ncbi:MAG: hypothetical protein K2L19_00760 [Eubacterium sp.]|nr:hypothetical protein [Eubacterium sp.]
MKKHAKLMSIILAVLIVVTSISSTFVVFAKDNYKPKYTQTVTEEDVAALIGDVNTILEDNVLTGATIESIYKMLPQMKSLLMLDGSSAKASDKGLFYKESQPERFSDLPDGQLTADVYDDAGNIVTEGTLTAFFKEHPIVCENAADFKTELDAIVKMVLVQNIMDTFQILPMFAGDFTAASIFGTGIDEVCKALGIEQEKSAATVLGFNAFVTGESYDIDGANAYIQNITAALFPDTANAVIDMLQRALIPENAKLLYSGLSKIVNNLDKIVTGLSSNLSGMGVDIAAVQETIANIKDTFAALPTTGEGEDTQLDIQGVVGYLISSLTDNAVGIKFGNNAAPSATVVLNFTDMQLDRVINAESNADVVKIVYDYLYDNLIGNRKTNMLLFAAIDAGIIESALGITLPEDVKTFMIDALEMQNDELADELIVMVADAAGREISKDPETPEDPSNPTDPEEPTDPSNPADDKKDPANPLKPIIGNNDKNSDSDNTNNADKNSNTGKTTNNKLVKSSAIPNTGVSEAGVTMLSVTAVELVVIALALAVYAAKKRNLFSK